MTTESEVSQVAEHARNAEHYMRLALALGYNELAKLGRTLGEKIYFRLLRDKATDELVEAGGNGGKSPFANEEAAIEIYVEGDRMPWIRLLDRDVELMRAYVAEHDAAKAAELPSEGEVKP